MRFVITGITGFVRSHMAEYAIGRGAEVIGSARWRSRTENVEHLRGIRLIEDHYPASCNSCNPSLSG